MKQLLVLTLLVQLPFLLKAQVTQEFIIGVYNSPSAHKEGFQNLQAGHFNTIYMANPNGLNPWKACEEGQDAHTFRGKAINLAAAEELKVLLDGNWAEESSDNFTAAAYNKMNAFTGVLFPPILGNTKAEGWALTYAMRYDRMLRSKYPKKQRHITVLPNYASRAELGDFKVDDDDNYKAYLQLIYDKLEPQSMTLAHYPMTLGEGAAGNYAKSIEKEGLLENLETLASFCQQQQLPFYANIMGTAHGDRKYAPTFFMYRMMAHAAVVYGVEGIFYYTYKAPCAGSEQDPTYYGPFIGAAYLHDKAYWTAVKKMNRGLKYMGPHLLKADRQYTERWQRAEETHKICLDSCELLRIPEYDTSWVKMDSIPAAPGFLVAEDYDTCWIASSQAYRDLSDSSAMQRLKMFIATDFLNEIAADSIVLDSSTVDSMLRKATDIDDLGEAELDSLAQIYLAPSYELKVVSQRIKELDLSKNIHINLEGENTDLLFSLFDYGKENKMIILMNYNYDKNRETKVAFDFGEDYKALELSAASQSFTKRFQKHETNIEGGDIRVFVLKKVEAEED